MISGDLNQSKWSSEKYIMMLTHDVAIHKSCMAQLQRVQSMEFNYNETLHRQRCQSWRYDHIFGKTFLGYSPILCEIAVFLAFFVTKKIIYKCIAPYSTIQVTQLLNAIKHTRECQVIQQYLWCLTARTNFFLRFFFLYMGFGHVAMQLEF